MGGARPRQAEGGASSGAAAELHISRSALCSSSSGVNRGSTFSGNSSEDGLCVCCDEPLSSFLPSGQLPRTSRGSGDSSGHHKQRYSRPAMASAADSIGGTEQSHISVPVADPGAWATAMNNLGIMPMGLTGQQLVSDSICIQGFDPNLGIIAPINPMMAGISLVPPPPVQPELPVIKEIIHCKSCTLFPQNPNLPPPSTRERPPGCKTVFVGGLPENASEEIIREVFDQCGEIIAIRKSKKNFCHIRFSEEFMVDKALYLSGYRMRIGSSTDKKDSGRIHVDFAQARDDLYEWECKQRLLAREERHRRKIQEDRLRPPSPPPIMHYSEHEVGLLAERLKDDNKFSEAIAVLFTWIERGEVNRRTANHFYSMIQSANSHVRRLMNEKAQHEEEMELAKEHFKNSLLAILTQFEQITAVFTAATRQKAWDHFSKAQRKNIDIWRKQCEELRNAHSEEIMGIRREEEMEMSDEDLEENPCKKIRMDDSALAAQSCALREENDSLRWQLDAYRNEVELLKKEQGKAHRSEEDHTHEQQLHFLQQTMHSMQQQLLRLQEELKSKELELEQARDEQHYLEGEVFSLREKLLNSSDSVEGTNHTAEAPEKGLNGTAVLYHHREKNNEAVMRGPLRSEKEALLLGVISTFLHVHPFGANIEYLWSYIQRLDAKISASELERLMVRLPNMFKQEFSGVGATLEKRWKFCGFEALNSA
ncbi:ecto-NOX disulfide-thiol exchanger 1 isoform X3 [Pygocentrus nattereri]|uniref:RRM domain-containing protein n=2 Tax=Pygocentrus nattereri TaxID=42514 RepID=A0A3B4E5I1_PYGNA|nr:ecto-NOX disulfide-thiol exchanger 1 isoform X3 [Pygocentrus nattereri]